MNTRKMTTREASAYLTQSEGVKVSPGTLEVWRCNGRGPEYRKVRSRVYYEPAALTAFAQGVPVKTTDSL